MNNTTGYNGESFRKKKKLYTQWIELRTMVLPLRFRSRTTTL